MPEQTEISFIRLVEAGGVPMAPDANGLFTVDQVAVLAAKRWCNIHKVEDYAIEIKCKVRGEWKSDRIDATQKGLWLPVEIFTACTKAAGKKVYVVDLNREFSNPLRNDRPLNEGLIASIVGAAGVNPYLTRAAKYPVCHLEGVPEFWQGPIKNLFQAHIRDQFREFFGHTVVKAAAGDWTLPMLMVMCQSRNAARSSDYRKSLYALNEAGLIELTMGGRHGIGTATFEWTELAYLQPRQRLDSADLDALALAVA
jgi:hypothetical protein